MYDIESIWGPDAMTFRPQRWLEMKKPPSAFKFPTFNAGPRLCLGLQNAHFKFYILYFMQ